VVSWSAGRQIDHFLLECRRIEYIIYYLATSLVIRRNLGRIHMSTLLIVILIAAPVVLAVVGLVYWAVRRPKEKSTSYSISSSSSCYSGGRSYSSDAPQNRTSGSRLAGGS